MTRKRQPTAIYLALGLLAVLPFVNGVRNEFVYDDHAQVTRNDLVRSLDPRPIAARGSVTHGRVEWYRPLTIYTLALNFASAGDRPVAYHLTNLALHAANTCLVLSIAVVILGRLDAAVVAAVLFGVHAVHTEAVTPVFGRADLLACFFALAAWRMSLPVQPATARRAVAVGLCVLAGLLSKESAVAIVPAILFSDQIWSNERATRFGTRMLGVLRDRWLLYAALLLAVITWAAVRYAAVGGLHAAGSGIRYIENPLVDATVFGRVLTALWVIGMYIWRFLVASPLSADYSFDQIPVIESWSDDRVVVMAAGAAIIGATCFVWPRGRPAAPYLVLFGLLLLPVSNLVLPIGTIMAERLLYLPSVALCLLVGRAVTPILRRDDRGRLVAAGVVAVIACAHLGIAWKRNADWRTDETLFASTVRTSPRSAKAYVNHATTLSEHGDTATAESLLDTALGIAPRYPEAHNLLGTLQLAKGDLAAAERSFRAAVLEAPDYAPALGNLGVVLRRGGRTAEAETWLRRAIARDPSGTTAMVNLALVQEMRGAFDEAAELYLRAYQLDPTLTIARQRALELRSRGSRTR